MQLKAAQLASHLQQGLKPLYVLHGDEPLLVQEAADAIRAAASAAGYSERSSHTVSGAHFDWSEVLAAGGSLSLFADRQLLEVRIPSGKPGKEGGAALQQIAANAAESRDLLTLIELPRLDRSASSSAWFKALTAVGVGVSIDTVGHAHLPTWIAERLAAQDQRVPSGEVGQNALQFFAAQVEGNLLAAHQEIVKLGLLYPTGELSIEEIEKAVLNVARYDVFSLSESVLSGRRARVQRMLDGLQSEGVAAVLVHYTLANDIRALWRVQNATQAGEPMPMALRRERVWGQRERLFERVLPRLSPGRLNALLAAAHHVDGVVKGLPHPAWPREPWQALHRLAQGLCAACAMR